ncbi:hypothetical protein Tco_0908498 [Tanacetum coccineum]|uniref:Uncharacterized protein n=1 Tax=Tanacetum coccineum TaxID=301880 RepID=A0ABQ5CN18_9ASTR
MLFLYRLLPIDLLDNSDLYSEHGTIGTTSVPALVHLILPQTVIVGFPRLLKVSMVNTSLEELKLYLTGFDQVVQRKNHCHCLSLRGTWGNCRFQSFYQMEHAVEQHRLESKTFEVKMNQVLSENERLLAQAIDNDIVKTVVNLSLNEGCETVNECQRCLELKTELLNKKDFVDNETYEKLLTQAKDTVIVKLKEQIKSLNGNVDDSTVKIDMDEIEALNIELEHRVTKKKPCCENEHLKQTYKQLYDSIKPKRVQSKEQCDALIKQVNIKSGEISDLNAKLQEQGVRLSTSASGSQPSGNTRNDRIRKHKNGTVKVNGSASVQNSKKQDDSDYVCVNSNDCMSSDNLCVSNSLNVVKFCAKPKQHKSKKAIWKPTGKVFTQIGYIWRPTGRTFTIIGNSEVSNPVPTTPL